MWRLSPRVNSSIATITFASILSLIIGVVVEINIYACLWLAVLPEVWHLLTRLEEDLDQVVEHRFILVVDKGGGETHIADACSAAYYILAVEDELEECGAYQCDECIHLVRCGRHLGSRS